MNVKANARTPTRTGVTATMTKIATAAWRDVKELGRTVAVRIVLIWHQPTLLPEQNRLYVSGSPQKCYERKWEDLLLECSQQTIFSNLRESVEKMTEEEKAKAGENCKKALENLKKQMQK